MTMNTDSLQSCLYDAQVMHHRLWPKVHRFVYSLFMFYLNLDELDTLQKALPCWSHNRWNLYSFFEQDHLPPESGDTRTLKQRLTDFLAENGMSEPVGRVMLLTHCRVLGYVFNPVSFFVCYDSQDRPLALVIEVGNTFNEVKPYYVPLTINEPDHSEFELLVPKQFYVSPFSSLSLLFHFRVALPGDRLQVWIDDVAATASHDYNAIAEDARDALPQHGSGQPKVLLSTLMGQRRALTLGTLLAMTVRYPLVTVGVIALIHWQAFKLWVKRVPFHDKHANPENQTQVLRPHRSLHR